MPPSGLVVLRRETNGERRYALPVTYVLHPGAETEPEDAKDFTGAYA